MNKKSVFVVLLFEDVQHKSFVYHFLKKRNIDTHNLREYSIKPGKGSAEQFVREQFLKQLKWVRERNSRASTCLIVVADADKLSVQERLESFEQICKDENIPFRNQNESIAFIIPKRNIETWLAYLRGENANEEDEYPKYKGDESRCKAQVEKLDGMCRAQKPDGNPPPSLIAACDEFRRLKF